MHTPTGASLLDEQEFLAELEQLEHGMTTKRRTPLSPVLMDAERATNGTELHPRFDASEDVPTVDDGAPSLLWRVTAAAMFMFFMGVGAAGAAVVFHERVARILATW